MNRCRPTRRTVDTLKSAVDEPPTMSEDPPEDETAPDVEDDVWDRETAPQSPFTMRQVGIGLLVFAGAAAVAFGVPILLT